MATRSRLFILEKAFPDSGKYFLYRGCKVNTLKWGFGEDSEMTVELAIMGALREIASATYDASATSVAKLPISQNHTYVKIGGIESEIVKTGDFTLDAGLDGDQYVVGKVVAFRGDIPRGRLKQAKYRSICLWTDL